MEFARQGCDPCTRKVIPQSVRALCCETEPRILFCLVLLLLTYLLNQVDRYSIVVVAEQLEDEADFGDGSGQSTQYQLLAGPVFILVYTFSAIPLGMLADRWNRKRLMVLSLLFWSVMTILMGTAEHYWELVLLRMGQGIGEAGCTPTANGLITDYFPPRTRATALGVYNWGIYIGYSMAVGVGNVLASAQSYRAVFYVFGGLGIPVAVVLALGLVEPLRGRFTSAAPTPHGADSPKTTAASQQAEMTFQESPSLLTVLRYFVARPGLIVLILAGAMRNGGGFVFAYNANTYYQDELGASSAVVASYLSWVPIVGGCVGATLGGALADAEGNERLPSAASRTSILVLSQLTATPFAAAAVLLPVPYCFLCLVPTYIVGEMWVGVTLAVLCESVPSRMRITSVAMYFFLISNIGGNCPLLMTSFKNAVGAKGALLLLYPGLYLTSSLLFFISLQLLQRHRAHGRTALSKAGHMVEMEAKQEDEEDRSSNELEQLQLRSSQERALDSTSADDFEDAQLDENIYVD